MVSSTLASDRIHTIVSDSDELQHLTANLRLVLASFWQIALRIFFFCSDFYRHKYRRGEFNKEEVERILNKNRRCVFRLEGFLEQIYFRGLVLAKNSVAAESLCTLLSLDYGFQARVPCKHLYPLNSETTPLYAFQCLIQELVFRFFFFSSPEIKYLISFSL